MSNNCNANIRNNTVARNCKSMIQLTINGIKHQVPEYLHPKTTLNYFIRNFAKLTGTKYMCLEGGCGACIVTVCLNNQTFSVNTCLVPIFLCNGWTVITIEGIGSKASGYNPIQNTLAELNGSQCGYCSPAMVMNMYSLVQSKMNRTYDIENSFGGNICRCTGYRSILDAFQLFAINQEPIQSTNTFDIEDSHELLTFAKNCSTCKNSCNDFVTVEVDELEPIHLSLDGGEFFKVFSVYQIFEIFGKYPHSTYILNGGNTGNGVFRIGKKDIYIDINGVHDLHRIEKNDDSLTLGGETSLQTTLEIFRKISTQPGFEYLQRLAKHIDLIGHISMRNIGTIAGNLMLKHEHNEFISDLFLILETAGAEIHILQSESTKFIMSLLQFLNIDMRHKLIYSIVLRRLSNDYNFTSYKILPVAQNAHAIVNAGFLFKLDLKNTVLQKPNIIFGGINPKFYHAEKTENFLVGKRLIDKNVLEKALNILDSELNPDYVLPDSSPQYRKLLAEGLFYKFILSLQSTELDFKLRSGSSILHRKISSGVTTYNVDKKIWPLNEPLTKLEAIYQTSGEAMYVNDVPLQDREVFCVLTLAPRAGKIKSIDYNEAMQMNGVIAFYSAKDIPGKNICVNSQKPHPAIISDEPLFADTEALYAGQPFGVIAAISEYKAFDAVKKVNLIYADKPLKKPIITIKDALDSKDSSRLRKLFENPATKPAGEDVKFRISGNIETNSQYHYTLEPQSCLCTPIEDGLNISISSQFPDFIQYGVATVLGIPQNTINLTVKRVGGAYGCKLTRPIHPACACALVAYKLNRPARLIMSIEDMMKAMGKRPSGHLNYDIGVNESGRIQFANMQYFSNEGYSFNDVMLPIFIRSGLRNCYDYSTWNMAGHNLKTDLPCSTWCRAPGTCDGTATIETIMQHIARVTKKDLLEVKLENLNVNDKSSMQPIVVEILKTSEYEQRRNVIETYNQSNRWKKRGIAIVIMKFELIFLGPYYALVSIYARDGTVSITHAGIEIGQGINTKVAQVAAYVLGIDVDMVRIKPYNNASIPNAQGTSASITSDSCTSATKYACEELLERLKPIRQTLDNPTWQQLVFEAFDQGVDLCAIHQFSDKSNDLPKPYSVYGATVAEVEIDVLTGQHIVQRVDLIEDTGVSMNQKIDVGQIQGAFIMGLGRYTSEELIFDPNTGALTNYRTWNYKPPGAKDIPIDFRVSLLKNTSNAGGTLRSKTTGEPALCMGIVIPLAIRNALDSARSDAGNNDAWYEMGTTATAEKILLASLTSKDNMTL